MITAIRRELAAFARSRQRLDLARLFGVPTSVKTQNARKVADAIEILASLGVPSPSVTDDIDGWLAPRTVNALRAHGIRTLHASGRTQKQVARRPAFGLPSLS